MQELFPGLKELGRSLKEFAKAFRTVRRTSRRWRMQAPSGQNRKERKRNQTMLKGRRCRVHKGAYPRRGPGRTAHGRR